MAGYTTTTLGTLRTRVRERLLAQFWSDTELNIYINESLRVWNILTGYARSNQTKTIGSGSVPFYTITSFTDTGMLVLRIEKGSATLSPITLESLDYLNPTWVVNTATTSSFWVHVGQNIVALNPIPTISFSATTYYINTMPLPANDADDVQVGEEDIPAIVDYIVFVARLKEGGKEAQEASALFQNFIMQASKYNAKLLKNALFRRVVGLPQSMQSRPDQLDQQFPR